MGNEQMSIGIIPDILKKGTGNQTSDSILYSGKHPSRYTNEEKAKVKASSQEAALKIVVNTAAINKLENTPKYKIGDKNAKQKYIKDYQEAHRRDGKGEISAAKAWEDLKEYYPHLEEIIKNPELVKAAKRVLLDHEAKVASASEHYQSEVLNQIYQNHFNIVKNLTTAFPSSATHDLSLTTARGEDEVNDNTLVIATSARNQPNALLKATALKMLLKNLKEATTLESLGGKIEQLVATFHKYSPRKGVKIVKVHSIPNIEGMNFHPKHTSDYISIVQFSKGIFEVKRRTTAT
jgi:hypothetical protein